MEELQSCAHLMLQLGAGCTAPPPTPIRRAEPVDSAAPDDDIFWSSPPSSTSPCCSGVDYADDVGTHCSSSGGILCQNSPSSSTPPSRAELDELALYLMQQSLLSTPTLLASPSLRRRQKQGYSPDKSTNGGTNEKSSRNEQETQHIVVGGARPATYSYSMDGFCEESKTGVRRVCEENGAFYVRLPDFGKASLVNVDHLVKQCLSMNGMCLIGSCPLLPISELMPSLGGEETVTCRQENGPFEILLELPFLSQNASTAEAMTEACFREAMSMFANLLVGISKKLLKLLLEDVSGEIRGKLRGHFLNPLLYIYKHGSQEPCSSRCDDDVVLSIISHGNSNHEGHNEKVSLLTMLGSQIQAWSEGKFKAPTLLSLCNLVDEEVCFQFDLVYQL